MKYLTLLPALALLLAACNDVTAPVEQNQPGQSPSFAISDGANSGNEHFFFLPPMVKDPGDLAGGVFDATLSAEVQICVWRLNDEECGPNLEMYTMDTGPRSEMVRVNETDELYIVLWHTDDILATFPLGTDEVYRIRVLAEGKELGYADVVVVSSGKELKNYRTGELIPLIDGHRMPIKFRIEEGALEHADPVAGGWQHTCAITTDGDAYCWGYGGNGQLGNGTRGSLETSPVAVVGGLSFASLTAGDSHTCGLTANGLAYCWGHNTNGQLGTGTNDYWETSPAAVAGGHSFVSLSAGIYHTCGLTTNGDAYCWGSNSDGQIGNGTVGSPERSPVAVTGGHSFDSVDAGYFHTCGLTATGDAYCWGNNANGELGNGSYGTRETSPVAVVGGQSFIALAAGGHTCGLTGDGDAYCWGNNWYGKLGNGTSSARETSPVAVVGGLSFASLTAGEYHTCGVTVAGYAYCWGYNAYGQLGNGETSYSANMIPSAVVGGYSFTSVTVGVYHTCGATTDGYAYCWGNNWYGQIGNGTTSYGVTVPEVAMDLDP